MPSSSRRGSRAGAPGSYTDRGPPDRIRALASWARTVSGSTSQGTTSEKTWHSRTRRAMSWAYSAPKSSTRTVSCPGAGVVMGAGYPAREAYCSLGLGRSTLIVKGATPPLGAKTSHRTPESGCVVRFCFPAKEATVTEPEETVAAPPTRRRAPAADPAAPRLGRPPAAPFGAPRPCAAESCETKLSRYNPDSYCSVHRGWDRQVVTRRRRGEDEQDEA